MALIHHYRLEEDGRDSIGGLHLEDFNYTNNPNSGGDLTYSVGKIGSGLERQFGATGNTNANKRLRSKSKILLDGSVSYSAWVRVGVTQNSSICGVVNAFDHTISAGITLYVTSLAPTVAFGLGGTRPAYSSPVKIQAETWAHIVATYNHATGIGKIYVDGQLTRTTPSVTVNVDSLFVEIGSWSTSYVEYGGQCIIDDVRIYDHPLSEREVRDLSLGMVAHFKFDNDLYDNAQYTLGVPLNEPVYSKGKFGNALMRTTGYNRVDLETPINITDGVSYAFWLYYDYDTQGTAEIAPVSTNINKFHSIVQRNSRKIGAFDGSWRLSNYIVPDKEWHHYAYVLSNGVIALYVDGEYFGNISVPNLVEPIYSVAGSIVGSNRQPAMMEDLRIFTTSISAETIKEIYQQRLSIDSQGNMYTAHLDETTGSDLPMSITNGSLLCTVSEVDDAGNPLNSFSIDGSTVHTKEIREC